MKRSDPRFGGVGVCFAKICDIMGLICQRSQIKIIFPMDNQSQFPIGFFNFKNSDKNSDILSIQQSNSLIDLFGKKEPSGIIQFPEAEISQEKAEEYFNLLFSPKGVAESLIRRNQFLEMKNFDNSDSEPEELYNRRKKRVTSLKEKQNKKIMILSDIREKQPQKFKAMARFMKLFGQVKQKIHGIRHDYYSEKTFLALKKASSQELLKATKVLSQILNWALTYDRKFNIEVTKDPQEREIQLYLEFLIIPRFFISKQKLMKLVNDESIQESFKFLIYHTCLGHYNNQANKRLPQESQMKYVRELLIQPDGRERFKKICTINHGGNFFKKHNDLYYELYYKNLDCLKKVQQIYKRKHMVQELTQQLTKPQSKAAMPEKQYTKVVQNLVDELNIINWPIDMVDEKSVSQFLKSLGSEGVEPNLTKAASLIKSTMIDPTSNTNTLTESKLKMRRPYSLMTNVSIDPKLRIKKSFTVELGMEPNIILVHPPEVNTTFNQKL